jgi:hypothetical protein
MINYDSTYAARIDGLEHGPTDMWLSTVPIN